MARHVYIRMMGSFVVEADGVRHEQLASRSHKGVSLVEYLILHEGKTVSNQRLYREFWSHRVGASPEASLKTLVSRTRALLNDTVPDLGACIVSEQGGYRWEPAEGSWADVTEILAIVKESRRDIGEEQRQTLSRRLLELYTGDLFLTGDMNDGLSLANWLHREYLDAVYLYLDQLRRHEAYNEICTVCEQALRVDDLDDNLHLELMKAMVNLNRSDAALRQYELASRSSRKYLDAEPGDDIQSYYQQLTRAGQQIRFNLDVIRNELMERDRDPQVPFFCDYATFKEIYNIQMRNLERLGTTMSLGVIMIGDSEDSIDAVRRESAMAGLMEILRQTLRKGDIVTRFSQSIVAMLLPTVNYSTGSIVMERIFQIFRAQYPTGQIPMYYRVSLLGGDPA